MGCIKCLLMYIDVCYLFFDNNIVITNGFSSLSYNTLIILKVFFWNVDCSKVPRTGICCRKQFFYFQEEILWWFWRCHQILDLWFMIVPNVYIPLYHYWIIMLGILYNVLYTIYCFCALIWLWFNCHWVYTQSVYRWFYRFLKIWVLLWL